MEFRQQFHCRRGTLVSLLRFFDEPLISQLKSFRKKSVGLNFLDTPQAAELLEIPLTRASKEGDIINSNTAVIHRSSPGTSHEHGSKQSSLPESYLRFLPGTSLRTAYLQLVDWITAHTIQGSDPWWVVVNNFNF